MKILNILYEVLTVAAIYIIGILLGKLVPIPSSLISMAIFFILLATKVLKEDKYNNLAKIILMHLAFFFIPPAVKIMDSMDVLSGNILKIVAVLVISNILVMGVTGTVVQFFVKREKGSND